HHRPREGLASQRLDASIPGVRTTRLRRARNITRLVTRRAHRSPRPTFRDGRHAPLAGTGYALKAGDLPLRSTRKKCDILARRANHQIAVERNLRMRRVPFPSPLAGEGGSHLCEPD